MSLSQEPWYDWVCQSINASSLTRSEHLQSLWSGYGEILRLRSPNGSANSVILKRIAPPDEQHHPRGWNSDRSHQRKLRSYEVENSWYEHWQTRCTDKCLVPRCLGARTHANEHWLLLEDMDASGYPQRADSLNATGIDTCLRWLANFHGRFLNCEPTGLWPVGTYWHLGTRPDEWAVMEDIQLKQAAHAIDAQLSSATFKTIVHGDAKVANFCFAEELTAVAAVDFQYVGGGCGMKDVVYFLGSCLSEDQCERGEKHYLETYFTYLKQAVNTHHPNIDFQALESEWRLLFPVAWTDFHRFLLGWMPGHWKVNGYSRRLAAEVLAALPS